MNPAGERLAPGIGRSRYWCERAWLGLERGVADGVLLTVADGTFVAVDAGVEVPAGATRLDGLTLPGIANAHSHAFHRALRGRTHGGGGTFWTWRERMYDVAATLDPDGYEALATAVFAEMVLAGYTAVGEFHYLHHGPGGVPYADRNEMGARLVAAADRAGLRITVLDTCYLHGGIGTPLEPVQQRFSDGSADAWAERMGGLTALAGPTVAIGAAVHSVRAVDPSSIAVVATWAGDAATVLHAHVSEQPAENEACAAAHGCTPVGLLHRHGAVDERFTAVHATHLTSGDIELLGGSSASCCFCATTERDLADGIGPSTALLVAGTRLCIGSDSHAVIDPFEETRAIELDERLATLRRGSHTPARLLAAATVNGYRSLGWPGGDLAAGTVADFVTLETGSVRLAGADDLAAAAVFSAAPADVHHVVVGGRVVVADGRHVSIDVPAALADSIAAVWSAT